MSSSDEVKTVKAAVAEILGKCRVVARVHGLALHVSIPEEHFRNREVREKVFARVLEATGRSVVGAVDPATRLMKPYATVENSC